jgi:O-antigen ligase
MLPSSIAICIFWLTYLLRSTVFAGWGGVSGLFYPVYLIIVFIAVRNFVASRKSPEIRLWLNLYFLFLFLVIFSMFRNQKLFFDFQTFQMFFIYCLALLCFFQFTTPKAWQYFKATTVFASAAATVWVLYTSLTTSAVTIYRGGIDVDANYVSMLILIGTLAVSGKLTEKISVRNRVLISCWTLLAFYAMTILGSRGMSVALLVGILILFLNSLRRFRTLAALLTLGLVVFLVLPELPGSDMLAKRFSGANIETLNGRIVIWQDIIRSLERGTVTDMLFGYGFRASEDIVAAITGRILTSTHNGYLRVFVEQGLVGLVLFLSMLGLIVRRLWRERKRDVGVLTLMIALLVTNLSISSSDGFIFWIVLGAAGAYAFKLPTEEQEEPCSQSA